MGFRLLGFHPSCLSRLLDLVHLANRQNDNQRDDKNMKEGNSTVKATLNKGARTLTAQWSLLGKYSRLAKQTINMLPDSVYAGLAIWHQRMEDSRASFPSFCLKGEKL